MKSFVEVAGDSNKQTQQKMSGQLDGERGGGGQGVFLSAHRCPEVDRLPQHNCEPQSPAPCSLVPAEKSSDFTCTGKSEADYLDICSTRGSNTEEEEQDEGSISDWSEEDLSLHFSPSVIIQSDDESDPESGFECIDVTMETQVRGQEGEGLKMVPKRQIQLKKKKDNEDGFEQVIPAEGGGANNDLSASELHCPNSRLQPGLLLRQHSMPTSFYAAKTTSSDADGFRVYKGLVAGASQVFLPGETSRHLQKSFSLDETKTKMASCLIKNVLSKKMQVEQKNMKKNSEVLPILPPPVEQQGGQVGGGVSKVPVHMVRDIRSLVKHTYSLSNKTSASHGNNPQCFKGIGQEDSPPPTYQQAVGAKGHVAKVAASFSQSQDKKQSKTFSLPITQQRRGSEPIIGKGSDLLDPSTVKLSQSETAVISSTPQGKKLPLSAQKQSSIMDLTVQPAPGSSQQLLQPTSSDTLHPHLGKVGYVHTPLTPPAPILHLPRRSKEVQNSSTGTFSDEMDWIRTETRMTGDQEGHSSTATPPTMEQPEHQQHLQHCLPHPPFLCSLPGFLPAQKGADLLVDVSGSPAAPGALIRVPAPCQLMLDPKSGRCFYMNTPLQSQRKMLLDPETGQLIQVFLPAAGFASNATMFPVCRANPTVINPTPALINYAPNVINPTPAMFQGGGANPTLLSVMQFQPVMGVSSLYSPSYIPVTVMTSHPQHSDDITPTAQ